MLSLKIQYNQNAIKNLQRFNLTNKEKIYQLETKLYGNHAHLVKDSDIVFISRSPDKNEAKYNMLFPQNTIQGKLFDEYLLRLGLSRSEVSNLCMVYNVVEEIPLWNSILSQAPLKYFEFSFIRNYKVIFLMCNDSLRWFFGFNFGTVRQSLGEIYYTKLPKGILGNEEEKDVVIIPLPHPTTLFLNKEMSQATTNILKLSKKIIYDLRGS